jgi:hypothetical protein
VTCTRGTQQRLVALDLTLHLAQATVPAVPPELQTQIGRVADELTGAIEETPAILSEGGLGPALCTLARRAALPVELDIRTDTRAAERIEVAATTSCASRSPTPPNTPAPHTRASRANSATPPAPLDPRRRHRRRRSRRRLGPDRPALPRAGPGRIDRGQQRPGKEGTAILVELPLQPA